ncbi:MAG: hypothetical protein ABI700_04395 [Chloroflexota bacterium]
MDILRFLHTWIRWIVVVIALIDLVYFAIGWLQARAYDQMARRMMLAFSMSISIQWLVGLIYLIALGSVTGFGVRFYWEHAVAMTIAVFVANVPSILRRRPLTDKQRFLVNVGSIIAVIILVIIGISALPEAIRWRFSA